MTEDNESKHCVYFIQQGITGPVKIGLSRDLDYRFKSIQVSNPYILKLVFAIPCKTQEESKDVESLFHKKLKPYWMRGEWFDAKSISYAKLIIRDKYSDRQLIREITDNGQNRLTTYDAQQVHEFHLAAKPYTLRLSNKQ